MERGIIYPKDDEALTLGFAADFIDLFGYSFSEVQEFAEKDKDVRVLVLKYNEMIELYEQKLYFEGLKAGRFQNILEKRLESRALSVRQRLNFREVCLKRL